MTHHWHADNLSYDAVMAHINESLAEGERDYTPEEEAILRVGLRPKYADWEVCRLVCKKPQRRGPGACTGTLSGLSRLAARRCCFPLTVKDPRRQTK